jgi:hypothetical protein
MWKNCFDSVVFDQTSCVQVLLYLIYDPVSCALLVPYECVYFDIHNNFNLVGKLIT